MSVDVALVRYELEITQATMAKLFDVSERTIRNWENSFDSEPSAEIQEKLKKLYENIKYSIQQLSSGRVLFASREDCIDFYIESDGGGYQLVREDKTYSVYSKNRLNDRPVRVLKGFASADGAEKAWRNQLWNCLKNDSEWIVRKCIKPNLCEIERDDWIELVKQEQWDDVDEIVKIVDTHFSGRSEHMSSPFVQCNNCDSAILNPIYLFEIPVENLSHESYRCKCENPADHYIL